MQYATKLPTLFFRGTRKATIDILPEKILDVPMATVGEGYFFLMGMSGCHDFPDDSPYSLFVTSLKAQFEREAAQLSESHTMGATSKERKD